MTRSAADEETRPIESAERASLGAHCKEIQIDVITPKKSAMQMPTKTDMNNTSDRKRRQPIVLDCAEVQLPRGAEPDPLQAKGEAAHERVWRR